VQIIDWEFWLDQHIPYYEAARFRTQYETNPPQVVLEISAVDRYNNEWSFINWDCTNEKLSNYNTTALFLQRDTHQMWYWAFWDKNQVLMAIIILQ